MGWAENKIEYDKKYYRENVKSLHLKFIKNNKEDMMIYDHCKNQENITQYIKGLIKKDMKKSK